MNIRMTVANSRGVIMSLDELDNNQDLKDTLSCVDCQNKISYVSASIKNSRRSHLRATWNHKADCKFNGIGLFRQLCKDSDGAFTEIGEGKFLFQIDLNNKERRGMSISNRQAENKPTSLLSNQNLENRFTSYIRTLKRIVEIKKMLEESDENDVRDSQIRNLITLQINGQKVNWSQFYYEEETGQLKKCFNYGQKDTNKIVCIEGMYSIRKVHDTLYVLTLKKPFERDRNEHGHKEILSVSFQIRQKEIAENFQKSIDAGMNKATVLSVVNCSKSAVKNDDYLYLDIRGDIISGKQIYFHK
ncbi:hypothetical protein PGH26_02040 [Sporosarcina jeotgali]|uniref:Uncharacterized protein n=1 Tax=Sporosarcina jeotgali TaxID=3020056 RepID=A0ABZ0KWF8_9BACL|nr:hypothetical protein [Sporosarcina sp. B2O-1]WOV84729.1 hypothetical protein PGH26_02040 [Sporosarcina sp. B2O-1]